MHVNVFTYPYIYSYYGYTTPAKFLVNILLGKSIILVIGESPTTMYKQYLALNNLQGLIYH